MAFSSNRHAALLLQPGGGERVRTDDLLRARQALSQLSYTPNPLRLVGLGGLEPPTSRLSGVRSKPNRKSRVDPTRKLALRCFLKKEVIQPQVPLGLPCYDFTPVTSRTLAACPLAVSSTASGTTDSRGVTGGVYKARERIHRGMLIHDY